MTSKLNAIHNKLQTLYGNAIGTETFATLKPLLTPITTSSSNPTTLSVTERDVVLICYGDHVQSDNHPPLQTLHHFLKTTVAPHVNSVHILPFYPWSSDDGFSVKDYTAVDPALGTWEDVSTMGQDFRLMFDAVFNHVSAEGVWFQKYLAGETPYIDYFIEVDPTTDLSEVVRPRALPLLTEFQTSRGKRHIWTTFSPDQIDLNVRNPAVLIALIESLLLYVHNGAGLIRLDAIAFLWKEIGTSCIHLPQTHLIIQLMRDVLDIVAPDVVIITETNVPHEENLSYFGDGQNEAQMVYQFALPPLVLHTLATGDTTRLRHWARTLQTPSSRTTFFNFTASHDGIGMRPATGLLEPAEIDALIARTRTHGGSVSYKTNHDGSLSPYELNITYFDAITHPDETMKNPTLAVDRFIVSQAIQLSLAGVPGIYFNNLFGSQNWVEGVAQTERARTINREKFEMNTLLTELNDPQSIRHQVFSRYMQLIQARITNPAFHPNATQQIVEMENSVFAIRRTSQDGKHDVLALHNVTGEPVMIKLPAGNWINILTDSAVQHSTTITLDPYQVAWMKPSQS